MNLNIAVIVVLLGLSASILWSNPRKPLNQSFALASIFAAIWVYLFWMIRRPWVDNPVPWLRAIAGIGDFYPLLMWWTCRCAIDPTIRWRNFSPWGWAWLVPGIALASVAFSDQFIPESSTPTRRVFGPLYGVHQTGQLTLFLCLQVYCVIVFARLKGEIRRIARLFVGGAAIGTAAVLYFVIVLPRLGLTALAVSAPILALLYFCATAWTIANRQSVDSRHHLLTVFRRAVGLVMTSYLVTLWFSRDWNDARELQTVIGTVGGMIFLLVFEKLSAKAVDGILVWRSFNASRALQQFSSDIPSIPITQFGNRIDHLNEIINASAMALYWRSASDAPLRLVTSRGADRIPEKLEDSLELISVSSRERAPWWIGQLLQESEEWLADFAVCVPVVSREVVVFVALIGHRRSTIGYTEAEVSALQAVAVACHHMLVTRAMAEQEAVQRRLVYTGKVAAGMAHNIRKPLAVFQSLLEEGPVAESMRREMRTGVLKEIAHIQSSIDSLSALSLGERFAVEPHDLGRLVQNVATTHRPYLDECHATLEFEPQPGRFSVLAEPSQLEIAIGNLLRNAAEEVSSHGGGRIRITLGAPKAGWVELRMWDSGAGLPTHIREALFAGDLFARTTKPTGVPSRRTGYGFGLHSTMLIITVGHGGRFDYVEGEFVLTLPAAP